MDLSPPCPFPAACMPLLHHHHLRHHRPHFPPTPPHHHPTCPPLPHSTTRGGRAAHRPVHTLSTRQHPRPSPLQPSLSSARQQQQRFSPPLLAHLPSRVERPGLLHDPITRHSPEQSRRGPCSACGVRSRALFDLKRLLEAAQAACRGFIRACNPPFPNTHASSTQDPHSWPLRTTSPPTYQPVPSPPPATPLASARSLESGTGPRGSLGLSMRPSLPSIDGQSRRTSPACTTQRGTQVQFPPPVSQSARPKQRIAVRPDEAPRVDCLVYEGYYRMLLGCSELN